MNEPTKDRNESQFMDFFLAALKDKALLDKFMNINNDKDALISLAAESGYNLSRESVEPGVKRVMDIIKHLWIDLPSGERIDYRARMWLIGESNPHGIFQPQDFPDVIYTGKPIELDVLSPVLFEILTLRFDWQKFQQDEILEG